MPRVRQTPRTSVKDRPSAWRLMLRRQRRMLRPAALVAAASILLVLIAMGMHTASRHAGGTMAGLRERLGTATVALGLRVSDVQVSGRQNTPQPVLDAAIGLLKGNPILGFSLDDMRSRIESIPWVEQATVERRLPGTVIINLKERAPYAIWQNQGRFVLVDRNGQVVTNQDIAQFRRLPLIVGAGAPAAAAPLLDALRDRPALAERVTASVRVGQRRWDLHMANGTDVMLPEGHEVAALDRLMQLQQDHDVLHRPLAAIDLRLPDRLVFRPRPDGAEGAALPPPPAPPPGAPFGGASGTARKPT